MECGAAADIKNQIMEKLNSGMSKNEVLSFFVNRYGEKILSSPTHRGFNLTAWILPFAVVIFGIGTVYALLKSWTSRKKPRYEQVSFKEEDEVFLERIEEELRSLES
jgi:cytochrome c-type biogenesis protein CcmH